MRTTADEEVMNSIEKLNQGYKCYLSEYEGWDTLHVTREDAQVATHDGKKYRCITNHPVDIAVKAGWRFSSVHSDVETGRLTAILEREHTEGE